MDPNVWGPPLWFIMHSVAMNYPEANPSYVEQRNHYDFYHSLRNVLPCGVCREHYASLIKQYPLNPYLESRDQLVSWVVLIHNKVNLRYGKPEMVVSDANAKYVKLFESGSFCQQQCEKSQDEGASNKDTVDDTKNPAKHSSNRTNLARRIVLSLFIILIILGILAYVFKKYASV